MPSQKSLLEKTGRTEKESLVRSTLHRIVGKHHLPLNPPFRLVACVPTTVSVPLLQDGNLRQTDILHHSPDNGETTGFRSEGINLIGTLPDIAKEAFNRVGTANVAMHDLREAIKCQEMLFIFTNAPVSFRIALLVC